MELMSYAMDFASFLMQNLKETENIKSIVLFGSVARKQATKESDVDIFVDVENNEKKVEKEISKKVDDFFNSVKFEKYWKLLNINNEINVVVGKLDEWKLKDAMLGDAIILYQKYSPKLDKGKNKAVLTWGTIKNNSKRVMLNKKIFGYKYYKNYYKGLLEKYNGEKLGSNVILINLENLNLFLKIFHKFKIPVEIRRVFEYSE